LLNAAPDLVNAVPTSSTLMPPIISAFDPITSGDGSVDPLGVDMNPQL